MDPTPNDYGLDLHCTLILEEYREDLPLLEKVKEIVLSALRRIVGEAGVQISSIEGRVKTEESLAGKLELKGAKYRTLCDLTDIVGVRVVTFYTEDVDKLSSLVEKNFDVDWATSVDKRRLHALDSFGYDSLHYICRIPESIYKDDSEPDINKVRFELQMRTILQHAWATINHDTGYKSGFEVPKEQLRNLNRLAGMLELVDEQFSNMRSLISNYRRKVHSLVESGKFEEVFLDGDTFKSYLDLHPFDFLLRRIAKINQAEIQNTSSMPYLKVLKELGFNTIADVEKMKEECSEDAYKLAVSQLGGTDIDIIASSIALQDLITAYIIRNGGGRKVLEWMYELIGGPSPYNAVRAKQVMDSAGSLAFTQNDS